jgi:hypothetical protein
VSGQVAARGSTAIALPPRKLLAKMKCGFFRIGADETAERGTAPARHLVARMPACCDDARAPIHEYPETDHSINLQNIGIQGDWSL